MLNINYFFSKQMFVEMPKTKMTIVSFKKGRRTQQRDDLDNPSGKLIFVPADFPENDEKNPKFQKDQFFEFVDASETQLGKRRNSGNTHIPESKKPLFSKEDFGPMISAEQYTGMFDFSKIEITLNEERGLNMIPNPDWFLEDPDWFLKDPYWNIENSDLFERIFDY